MQVQIIYGNEILSKEQLHERLLQLLPLPAYYGKNLDALHDCLTEFSVPLELHIYDADTLCNNLGSYGEKFLTVLEDCQRENPLVQIKK